MTKWFAKRKKIRRTGKVNAYQYLYNGEHQPYAWYVGNAPRYLSNGDKQVVMEFDNKGKAIKFAKIYTLLPENYFFNAEKAKE